jgi:toxin-antitoxin system PIN domain toxin
VILVDINILLYATFRLFKEHEAARTWLDHRLSDQDPIGLPWAVILGYLRSATNRRIFAEPMTMTEAWRQASDWMEAEPTWIPQPTDRHTAVLSELLALPGVHGNLVSDAHLAALAIEHGLTLCSSDGDFARFPRLRWSNPLSSPADREG